MYSEAYLIARKERKEEKEVRSFVFLGKVWWVEVG